MANDTVPDAVSNTQSQELRISIWPDYFARFEGTAAQLIAEGLIPDFFEWPKAKEGKRWSANGLKYWMRRHRPKGHTGPMRSWLTMDNWFVRVEVEDRDQHWYARRQVEKKAEELRKAIYEQTPVGQAEKSAARSRYISAISDGDYLRFRSTLVALITPKRPRRTKPTPAQSS